MSAAEVFDARAPLPDIYDAEQVAEILKVSVKTVQREVLRGRLQACKVGRAIRITDNQLRRYLEEPGCDTRRRGAG